MLRSRAALALLAGSTLVPACGDPAVDAPDPPAPPPRVREIESPAHPGSGEPNLSAAGGRVRLSWIEPDGDGHALKFSTLEGDAWSAPRTIASGADWFVNWADFPSIVELPDGTLAAHWLKKDGPDTYAYGIRIVRSFDGGETWSEPTVPHDDGTETEHGFVTLYPAGGDRLGAVWLDGREYAGKEPGDPGAEMTLRLAAVAADGHVSRGVLLDPRVCDCCQTDVARIPPGLIVVYRDRSPEEVRDISVIRWVRDGWAGPTPVHRDGWTIEACPVNGPAIAARDYEVAVAWFTAADGTPRVLLARSDDGGGTFDAPARIDLGSPEGRVDVAILNGSDALVLWLERGAEGAGEVLLRRVAPDGTLGEPATVARTSYARSSGFPRMAVAGGRAVLAWTDPDEPARVRTAVAALD